MTLRVAPKCLFVCFALQSECDLRQSAFEAVSEVISAVGGPECYTTMAEMLKTLSLWLTQSFNEPANEELFQYQGSICGCLNNLIERLGSRLEPLGVSSQLFKLFVKVIEMGLMVSATPSASLTGVEGLGSSEERAKVGSEEDAIIAIGTLIRNAPVGFDVHLPELIQVLLEGLKRPSEVRVRERERVGLLSVLRERECLAVLLSSCLSVLPCLHRSCMRSCLNHELASTRSEGTG